MERRQPDATFAVGDSRALRLSRRALSTRGAPLRNGLISARLHLDGYHCHYSLADDLENVPRRAYGVITWLKKPAQQLRMPWDREGRVAISLLEDFALVNVYAVNGTARPYFADCRIIGDRHSWKRRFNQRLMEELRLLKRPLVMIGDWNISRGKIDSFPRLRTEEPHALARTQFNELISALDVADVFRERNPELRKYSWFRHGVPQGRDAARVDFALVSRGLNVIGCDIDD